VAAGLITLFYLWTLGMIVRIHEDMTAFLLTMELVIVTGVVIATVYGSIAAERERSTWDALILTRLTPGQILVGKIVWRLAIPLVVVILMAVPVALSASYRRSGTPQGMLGIFHLLLAHVIVLTWAALLAGFAAFVSARSRRSVSAMAVITGTLLGALLLVPMLASMFGLEMEVARPQVALDIPCWIWFHLNPFYLSATYNARIFLYAGSGDPSDTVLTSPFFVRHWLDIVPLVYAAGAALFFWGAHRSLRRIEEPARRSDT
jgi:ABC-type transport system involved in multi-copper enzyme maturation permease subunit